MTETTINIKYNRCALSNKRYLMMCYLVSDLINDDIEEGDWIYCFLAKTDKIKTMSSVVMAVESTNKYITIALPHNTNNADFTQCSNALELTMSEIDFEIIPKEYWFKVYRIDQLLDMINVGSIYGLEVLIEDLGIIKELNYSIEETILTYFIKDKYGLNWNNRARKFV